MFIGKIIDIKIRLKDEGKISESDYDVISNFINVLIGETDWDEEE